MKAALICLWLFTGWVQPATVNRDVVARVNSLPIQKAELLREMSRYRADVYIHTATAPENGLKKKAFLSLTTIKIQEALLKKYHLWPYGDYHEFLLTLQQTNQQRRKATNEGKVVYGPIVYDETTFFDYSFSNAVLKLQHQWHMGDPVYQRLIRKQAARAKLVIYQR
jgi:hypothetical protein